MGTVPRRDQAQRLRTLAEERQAKHQDEAFVSLVKQAAEKQDARFFSTMMVGMGVLAMVCIVGLAVLGYQEKANRIVITSLRDTAESQQTEIVALRRRTNQMQDDIVESASQNARLITQVKAVTHSYDDINDKIRGIQEDNVRLSKDVREKEAAIRVLQKAQAASRGTAVSAQGSPEGRAPAVSAAGEIILVNEEFQFVIVNAGTNQGVTTGMQLLVREGEMIVARLQVTAVRSDTCACSIQAARRALQTGDRIQWG